MRIDNLKFGGITPQGKGLTCFSMVMAVFPTLCWCIKSKDAWVDDHLVIMPVGVVSPDVVMSQ